MQNYFVILDTQMSLHKNSFDNQQRKFLCFIFIINLESKKSMHFLDLTLNQCSYVAILCFTMPVLASSVNK